MNPQHDDALHAAQRWYGTHRAEHLAHDCDRMVDRCAMHLTSLFPIAAASASTVAREALADLDSLDAPGFIDIDRSSSRLLVLRNTSGNTFHTITLPELFRMVEARGANDSVAETRKHPASGR